MKSRRPAHASSRGVLTKLVKGPASKKGPTKLSRRILSWAGQGLAGLALFALIVLSLLALFRPSMGERALEGNFEIEAVEDGAGSFPPERNAVAVAAVQIQNQRVLLAVTAEQRQGVEPGREVHVRYTYFPRLKRVRVESWSAK